MKQRFKWIGKQRADYRTGNKENRRRESCHRQAVGRPRTEIRFNRFPLF